MSSEEFLSAFFVTWIACTYMLFILICCGGNYNSGGDFGNNVNLFQMTTYLYFALTVVSIPIGLFTGLRYLCSDQISIFSKILWTLWALCISIGLVLSNIQSTLDSQLYIPFMFFSAVFMGCIVIQDIVHHLFCLFCRFYHIDD